MYSTGLGLAGTLSAVLVFLIKALAVLFFIGLAVGLVIIVTRYLFTKEDAAVFKKAFSWKKAKVVKTSCGTCGKDQDLGWKVCPFCGTDNTATENN